MTTLLLDPVLADLAARQHATISRAQARAAGLRDDEIADRLASGLWVVVHPGVYRIAGAPESYLQRLWAMILAVGPGAVVSHESAAALHRFPGYPRRSLTCTVAHGGHPRIRGAVVHQLRDVWPQHHRTDVVPGLAVTTAARTTVDLAAVVSRPRLRYTVDEIRTTGLVRVAEIGACLAEVARPGKPGVRKLARVLDELTGRPPAASFLERRFFAELAAGAVPPPIRQYRFPGQQDIDGCVDAAWPEFKLIGEADGRNWHTRIRDLRRDHERDAQAARAGWETLRFLYEHILGDPADMCATVLDTMAARAKT